MENKENIFLVKIQNCLKLLDEIEDTIDVAGKFRAQLPNRPINMFCMGLM